MRLTLQQKAEIESIRDHVEAFQNRRNGGFSFENWNSWNLIEDIEELKSSKVKLEEFLGETDLQELDHFFMNCDSV